MAGSSAVLSVAARILNLKRQGNALYQDLKESPVVRHRDKHGICKAMPLDSIYLYG